MEFCRRINDWQRHSNARIAVVEQDAEEDDFILALTSGEGDAGQAYVFLPLSLHVCFFVILSY